MTHGIDSTTETETDENRPRGRAVIQSYLSTLDSSPGVYRMYLPWALEN